MVPGETGSAVRPGRVRPRTLLVVCIGSYFAVRFSQVAIGPLVPFVVEAFAVPNRAIGTAITGMWVAYALAQLPSGAFADRLGEPAVIALALMATAVATLGMAVAPTFLLFGLGVVVLGIGAGLYYNPATTLLAGAFTGIGRAIGTHRIGGEVAGVVAPVAATAVGLRFGWRAAFLMSALVVGAVSLLFAWRGRWTSPKRPAGSPGVGIDLSLLRQLFGSARARHTTAMITVVEFVGLAAMAFLPTLLIEHHGMAIGPANALFAVFFGVSALSQPVGGWLSDRAGRDTTVALQMSAGVLGFGAFASGRSTALVVPAVVFAGFAMSSTPALQSRMLDELSTEIRGAGFGLFRTVYLLVGSMGTAVAGTTADLAGWGWAFGLLTGLFALNLLSILVYGGAGR